MDKPKLLSGHELVARGITKVDASLPEIGIKDVIPNGSWLEQKQIQSALEARKHIIGVERIEKSGALSHAEWREELMLAEVIRNVGGHWQYFGHHVGKQLFLKPEEALFLIEVNCLRLTYNDVTVSMQQAYSLLLRSKISLLQYKVYASLSRVGYKVYRHDSQKSTGLEKRNKNAENLEAELNTISFNTTTEEGCKDCKDNTPNETDVVDDAGENSHHQNCKKTEEKEKDCDENTQDKMEIIEDGSLHACDQENTQDKMEIIEDRSLHACDQDTKIVNMSETVKMNGGGNAQTSWIVKGADEVLNSHKKVTDKTAMDVDGEGTESLADCDKTNCLNITENIIEETAKDDKINEDAEVNMKTPTYSNCIFNTECKSNAQVIQNFVNESNIETNVNISNNKETRSENVMQINESMDEVTTTNDLGSSCRDKNTKLSEETFQRPELYHQHKIKKLENRKLRALDWKNTEKCFEKIPDISENQIVMVNVPEEEYIPRKVFLNNINYLLNLENIRNNSKSTRPQSSESRLYGANEEVNGDHIKRIKDTPSGNTPVTNHPLFSNNRFNRPFYQYPWRPNTNFPNTNFFPFNFMFRSFLPSNYLPRYRVFSPRPPLLGMYPRFNSFQPNEQRHVPNVNKKRRNSAKQKETHLEAIKNLAMRLRHLVQSGNTQQQNIDSLQRLISTFNLKYNMRLRLTDNFDVFNDETIVETITLDEDVEPSSKRARTEDDNDKYKENFNKLKQLSLKLKGLGHKQEVNSRHRRAFSSLIKKFNKSYNADVYCNSNFEVIDRRFVNLDSSSDSDCVIEETAKSTSTKKLKNPFSILKRLSERPISTSSNNKKDDPISEKTKRKNYSTTIKERFDKKWLPSEHDFGRAEILPKNLMNAYLIESKREEFLFEYMKSQSYEFNSWLDVKLSFLKSFEDTNIVIENDIAEVTSMTSLVQPNDCTDMPSVLKKLSIINNNKEIDTEASLNIDFDVYNRDVQNFRKSNRPKPHFRIICVSESSGFPNGKDVASLHSKYDDNVTIVFAVVGVGSISYLQINPIELPVYIPSNDLP